MIHSILTNCSAALLVAAVAFALGLWFAPPVRSLVSAIIGRTRSEIDETLSALDARLKTLESKRVK